ncbi:hypothetical protein AAG906_040814 [Vitis piasezkii]
MVVLLMMSFSGVVEALLKVIDVGGTFMELIITPVSERKRGLKILPTDHQEGLDSLGKFFVELQVIPEPLGDLCTCDKCSTLKSPYFGDMWTDRETAMETEEMTNKDMKVEISAVAEGSGVPVLTRQPSNAKSNCLCSPTTHAGSFRCRLHRAPSLQRTKSIDSASQRESFPKVNTASGNTTNNANTVEAQ